MPELFEMKRPLALNYKDGRKTVIVAYYPHPQGMVYLEPFWEQKPEGQQAVVVEGEVRGDGPWRVGDAWLTLVGCQGTDPELAQQLSHWEFHLQNVGPDHYKPEAIRELARQYGALV